MRRIIVTLFLAIGAYAVIAQTEKYYDTCAVKVIEQFSSYNNCNLGDTYKPIWKSWKITAGDEDKGSDNDIVPNSHEIVFPLNEIEIGNDDNKLYKNGELLKMVQELTMDHYRGKEKITYNSPETGFTIGVNSLGKKSDSHKCSLIHTEGYEFISTVIVDNPVKIVSSEVIGDYHYDSEAGEGLLPDGFVTTGQTIWFHLNKFYQESNNNDNITIEYRVNGENAWNTINTYFGSLTSEGSVGIRYSDMFHNTDNLYKNLGKRIDFRIEKKLFNNTIVHSNIVSFNFFYERPVFEIDESSVYISSCGHLNMTLKNVDDITLDGLKEAIATQWKDGIQLKFSETINEKEIIYVVYLEDADLDYNNHQIVLKDVEIKGTDENKKLIGVVYEAVNDGDININIIIESIAPIQHIDSDNQKNVKFAYPEQKVIVATRRSQLDFEQSPAINYVNTTDETDIQSYHLNQSDNPCYALLKMQDSDPYYRLPYVVEWYESGNVDVIKGTQTINKQMDAENIQEAKNKYFNGKLDTDFEAFDSWKIYFSNKFNAWFDDILKPKPVDTYTSCSGSCDTDLDETTQYTLYVPSKGENQVSIFCVNYYNLAINAEGQFVTNKNTGYSIKLKTNGKDETDLLWNTVVGLIKKYFVMEGTAIVDMDDEKSIYKTSISMFTYMAEDSIVTIPSGMPTPASTYEYEYKGVFDRYLLVRNADGKYLLLDILEYITISLDYFDSSKPYKISNCGDICAYVTNDNQLYVNGNSLGYVSNVSKVLSICGGYVYYEDTKGNKYQKVIKYEFNRDYYKDTFKKDHSDKYELWLQDFKDDCFMNYWLKQDGYKIYGVDANTDYTFKISDSDGCTTDVNVNVKVPIKPLVDYEVKTYPSGNCANDGVVSAKINKDNKGNSPLYYSYNGIVYTINDETETDLYGISSDGEIELTDDYGLTYIYTVDDIAEKYSNGIQSCVPYDNTCTNSNHNGHIDVSFLPSNTQSKTYKLFDASDDSEPLYSKTTSENNYSFTSLKSGTYVVKVNVGTCEYVAEGNKIIEDSPFSYTVTNDIVEVIGVDGEIQVNYENLSKDVIWKIGDDELTINSSPTIIEKPAGEYVISAEVCGETLTKTAFVKEPQCAADVIVTYKGNSECDIVVDYANSVSYTDTKEILIDGVKRTNASVDSAQQHTITYVYGAKYEQQWSVTIDVKKLWPGKEIFTVVSPHKCPDDNASYSIEPSGEDLICIEGNNYQSSVKSSTLYGVVNYNVKTISSEQKTESTSSFTIKREAIKSVKKEIPLVESLNAIVIPSDFLCSYSATTNIELLNITGGLQDSEKYWSFDDDKYLKLEGNKLTIGDPGVYDVYIKDGKYNCPSVKIGPNIEIARPSEIKASIEPCDPVCQDTWTGSVSVEASGGNILSDDANYNGYVIYCDDVEDANHEQLEESSYSLNKTVIDDAEGYALKTFEGKHSGTYYIKIYDNNWCEYSDKVTLKEYKNPYVTAATFDSVSCYGLSDGAIMVNTIHGTAPIDKYRLYDNNSGTEKASITLTNEELDNVVTSYKGEAFERDYIWNPATDKSIVKFEGLPSAKYYLCLTDVNGCETIEPNERFPIDVLQPDSLILNIDYEDTIIANYGMLGGTVNAHVEGGNSGWFNVSVDGKSVDTIIQNYSVSLADIFLPGKHYIKAEDSKQCADSAYTGEMRQPDSKLHLTAQTVDAMCKSSTGSITVAASGGWGGYQYSCSTVGEKLGFDIPEYIFTDLYGGTYKVSVNDSAGAVFDTTIIVNTPPELLAIPMPQDATCRDDGKIAVKISGGVMPYRVYSENFMADTIFIDDTTYTNVAAFPGYYPSSTYEVYVKDTNECTSVASVIITDSIPLASVKFICPSFHSVSNGKLTAHVDNGTSPYRYLWTNRNTDLTFADSVWKNISAGTYCLTVTDAHDCVANSDNRCDLCWFEYVPTTGDKKLTIDTICNETGVGAQDGFVRIVSDTSGYREIILYSCSSQTDMTEQILDQRQFELSGLSCGPYVLECRLPQGEVRYASFVIQEYKPLQLYVNNMLHALTPDSEDGRATVVIADGKAPYQAIIVKNNEFYMDTLLETNKLNLDGLGSGIYNVTVVDLYGKKRSIDFDINAPQKPLTLITDSVENVSCFSYDNGVIHLNAEGGWGEYQFAMDGGKYGNSATFGNRVAGSYVFVVIDKRGVTDTLQVDVEQPEKLSVGNPIIDTVSCYGYFDGSVKFNISGGNGGYVTYSDHGVSVHGDYVDNLNSDTYKFYFSDEKRCPSLDTLVVFIPQPDSLSISETIRHTTCDENNGSIRISVDGGIQPYTYFWDDSTIEKSEDQSYVYGLRQLGLYNVKVVDKNGCGIDKSFRIESSTKPRISRVSTLPIKCTGDSNGTAMVDSADIIPASPFAPFRIVWPNGQNQMEVNDLPAGRFSVTIVDTNECSSDFDFEVKSQTPLSIVKDGSRDAHCYNYTDGAISVIAYGGVGKFRYLWSNGDTLPQISNIGMGSYTVVVTDANECHDTATYSIGQPDSLYVDLGRDIYMCPDNTYEFDPGVYATYEWKRNDTVLSTERVLAADVQGLYCLEVTNDAGCFSHDSVLVTIGNDLLQADFVMASDAPIDDTIALIELSSIAIDSLRWEFDKGVFETIDSTAYEIYLKPDTLGIQTITLWAYSGGCVSYQTKQIEIVEQSDTVETANYGYNPLIKSILLKPNPNDGQFVVEIELREINNVSAYISNVGTGAQVTSFNMSGDSKYSKEVNISNSGSGVYVLRVVAGDETRSVRFMITR